MSREDWEPFKEYERDKKEKREKARNAFGMADWEAEGWTRHHNTHYSKMVCGEKLDYWPGPHKWRYKGKTSTGNVRKFIAKRIREWEKSNDAE